MTENLRAVEENVWVTLKNLQRYKTQSDAELSKRFQENEDQIFRDQKTDLTSPDSEVIDNYFVTYPEKKPRVGDIFIVETVVEGKTYEMSSYNFSDSQQWEAITGHVDASKVILRDNIKMAGAYTQVGNLTKTQTGTANFEVKGKSVAEVLTEIFSKKLQPRITSNPAVGGFSLSGAKPVEVGTKIATASFGTANLTAGSYEYGPATGVTAQSFTVDRIASPTSFNKQGVASAAKGTDDNNGAGFVIGDGQEPNTVTSLKYKVTVTHNEGVVAHDNLGGQSTPPVKINAGSKSQETAAYTGFRSFFYGATAAKPTLDSTYIRGSLTNANAPYSSRTITINVPVGATRVAIACISTARGVTKVINETALNADVTGTFTKQTINVEGANGYTAKPYNVWVFEPAAPYGQTATLKVTLG